jgi:hypothetical protein
VAAATDLAGDTAGGSAAAAIVWGVLVVAAGLAVWALARRTRRRWPVYLIGGVAVAVLLFGFFYAVSPLLPASF